MPVRSSNTQRIQTSSDIFSHSDHLSSTNQHHRSGVTTHERVGQDKYAPDVVRAPTKHDVVPEKGALTRQKELQTKSPRTKKHSRRRQTVQISGWGRPQLKAELLRVAEQEGLSLSQVVVALLEAGVREKLHLQHEILATPVLSAAMQREMNRLTAHLAEFLGRTVFETGQIRWIVVNALYRKVLHPGKALTKEEYYKLLDDSIKETTKHIRRWTPQLAEVIATIKKRLQEEEAEGER